MTHLRIYLLAIATGLALAGCKKPEPVGEQVPNPPPATTPSSPEPWVSLPTAQWPQMVLTNQAAFKGHTPLEGASAFLIRTPDQRVLAATALHLLGTNG